MATTTTNYGFDIPQSTDLVKDGATAIATLGQDIDTAMNTALGTKKAGMVLLNTTSFSGVSSQSINDVFNTTYKNYRILVNVDSATTSDFVILRLRVSGSDASGAGTYVYGRIYRSSGSFGSDFNSAASFDAISQSTSGAASHSMELLNPFETKWTTFHTMNNQNATVIWANGAHQVNTSYTGFSLISNSGTMTGSLSVYGYNK